MAISPKKQSTTSQDATVVENQDLTIETVENSTIVETPTTTIATDNTSTIVEDIYTNEAAKTYNRVMSFVADRVIDALTEKLPNIPHSLKYDDDDGINDTIEATLNRLGFATSINPHAIALLDRYVRSASQLLPSRDYTISTWDKKVFSYWRIGAFLVGHKPKADTVPKPKNGSISLPFERNDIVNAMRPFVEVDDKRGQAVIKTWESLAKNQDKRLFIDKYVLEILDNEGLLFAAVNSLNEAKRIADEMAENDRKALLDGLETSYKVVKKA
jgi:hypothetical protein